MVMVAMVVMISAIASWRQITSFKSQLQCKLRPMIRRNDANR